MTNGIKFKIGQKIIMIKRPIVGLFPQLNQIYTVAGHRQITGYLILEEFEDCAYEPSLFKSLNSHRIKERLGIL